MKNSDFLERKLEKLLIEAEKLETDVAFHQMDWAEWEIQAKKF